MAINKVVYDNQVLIDLTEDTVTPETLVQGTTAHDRSGTLITGALQVSNGTPEFVTQETVEEALEWLRENGDKSKIYALPDGYLYKYMTKEVTYDKPNCNNLFTNTNLLKGWRISSNNSFKSDGTDTTVTQDFIKVNPGQTYIIRGYNCGGIANIIEYSDIPEPFVLGQVASTFVAKSDGNNEKVWEDPKGAVHRFTHTMSSTTQYISFVLYTTDDTRLSEVIITLDEPVVLGTTPTTEQVADWYNTRQSYSSNVSEERVIAIEDALAALEDRVNSSSGDALTLPDYWKDHMDARVKAIREKMAEVGRNRSAFFFYSDAHWTDNARKSPMLLKYLYKYTPINKTNFGGDIVLTESYDYATMSYLFDSWRSSIRDLPNHHSVAGNHDDRNEDKHDHEFTIENVYSYLLAPEECNDRVDGEGLYYYIDDKVEKTRYIYLDTACYGGAYLSSEQTQFLVNSLTSTPSNYHIIIIGHAWFSQNYNNFPTVTADGLTSTTTKIVEIANYYNTRKKGSLTGLYVESSQSYSGTVSYDFSSLTGKVEFCLGGHLHNDHAEMFSNIPVIIVEADTIHNRNGSVAKAGTVSEQSISAVIADYKNNEVNFIRVGRGDSYKINLSTGEKTILTIDPLPEIKNLLDDAGYETGVRLNSSGTTTPRDTNDRWVTGFIGPLNTGDIIYFKNIEMLNDDYGSIVAHYYEDQSFKTGGSYLMSAASTSITYADDGTTIASYKMSLADIKWVRFCFVKIDENSIITINQPID